MSDPAKVQVDHSDFDDTETARTEARKDTAHKEKPKPQLLARLVSAAEKYGIAPDEIEACGSNQELSLLIDNERKEQAAIQRRSNRGGGDSPNGRTTGAVSPPPPPPPPADDEYEFQHLKESDGYDEGLVKELKRLGKLAKAAGKKGDSERESKLEERIERLERELAAERAANHPIQRRANAFFEKFPKLFGAPLATPGDGTPEGFKLKSVIDYVFWQDAQGNAPHNTNNPEKDIATAMKALGYAEPVESEKAKGGKTKIDAWAESGQAEPTNRNGQSRSGVPGGKREATRKIAVKMEEQGYDPGDIDDDPDDDDI